MKLLDPPRLRPQSHVDLAQVAPGSRGYFCFHDVDWAFYKTLSSRFPDSNVRITYSDGTLELMTTSFRHDRYKMFWDRLVGAIADVSQTDMISAGSTTLISESLEKGLEPDHCYYVQSYRKVIDLDALDLSRDPPPDLVIEVDITHVAVNRAAIYAAMGVPEMWVFDGRKLAAYKLVRKRWKPTAASVAFPFLRVDDLNQFLPLMKRVSEQALLRRVREWAQTIVDDQP
jgi:Uma2 family endonuclease